MIRSAMIYCLSGVKNARNTETPQPVYWKCRLDQTVGLTCTNFPNDLPGILSLHGPLVAFGAIPQLIEGFPSEIALQTPGWRKNLAKSFLYFANNAAHSFSG